MTAVVEAPPIAPVLRQSPIPLRDPVPARRVVDRDRRPPVAATQGTLALVSSRPPAAPQVEPLTPAVVVPPEDREWAARFVGAAVEVASGMRSPSQLIRWLTPDIHTTLQRRGGFAARARTAGVYKAGKPIVRSLRMQPVDPGGAYEVAAVVGDLHRVRAVAFRMDRFEKRWRVTALEIG